jgi:hypothetical protein
MNTYCPQCVVADRPGASNLRTSGDASRRTHDVALRAGDVLPIDVRGARAVVECLEGRVWVTQQGDSRDIVLRPGRSFTLSRRGRGVIQTLRAARVRLGGAEPQT